MKFLITLLISALWLLSSCAMFTAWRSIPAPGGCEDCHKVPISANWQVSYRPATLTDERNQPSFQSPESLLQRIDKPASAAERQKVEELSCFECHNAPNASHKTMKGKFHH